MDKTPKTIMNTINMGVTTGKINNKRKFSTSFIFSYNFDFIEVIDKKRKL